MPTFREVRNQIREELKELAIIQKETKQKRKKSKPNYDPMANYAVQRNRPKISALLDNYLEIRGKNPAHGPRKDWEWYYNEDKQEYANKYAVEDEFGAPLGNLENHPESFTVEIEQMEETT